VWVPRALGALLIGGDVDIFLGLGVLCLVRWCFNRPTSLELKE
jgi:hypothetical protein